MMRSNQEHGRNKSQNKLRNNKVRSKSRKRKDIQYYKCGKTRHIKWECPERMKGDAENKKGSSKSANIKKEDSESDDKDMLSR